METSETISMCSLTETGVDLQLRAWHVLHKEAISVDPIPNGAVMMLAPEAEDRVADLVAIESACCPSLSLVSRRVDGLIRLEVTSTHPDAAPLIGIVLGVSQS